MALGCIMYNMGLSHTCSAVTSDECRETTAQWIKLSLGLFKRKKRAKEQKNEQKKKKRKKNGRKRRMEIERAHDYRVEYI